MPKKIIKPVIALCALGMFFCLGCDLFQKRGTLRINLTDQPDAYEEVFITFTEVSVHRGEEQDNATDNATGEGWIVVSDEEQGFDLLTLQDGNFTLLAEAELEEGVYTQIRLKITDDEDANGEPKTYVKIDGVKYPLKVPSGTKSGLKLVHAYAIEAGSETVLYLDFDAQKSVKQTGSGTYMLKPTIAVLSELSPDQGIKGTVIDEDSGDPVAGALVVPGADGGDNDEIDNSATTNEDGEFSLPLPPGTYTLAISAEGYETFITEAITVATEFVEIDPVELIPGEGGGPGDDDDDNDDDVIGDDDDDNDDMSDDDDDTDDGAVEGEGLLRINLTDKPAENYQEVFITFTEVSVHRGEEQDNATDNATGGGWIVLSDEEQGFDLLTLQDGNFTLLAEAELAAGVYTQIRLKITDDVDNNSQPKTYVKVDNETYPLVVPSGTTSGLKLVHPFRVEADNQTVLYLDFDAQKSVKKTGSGTYKLKPTITVLADLSVNQGQQGITGTVQDADTAAPIEGASVAAFPESDDASGPNATATTNEEGFFQLPLPAGTYSLEVTAEGYGSFISDPVEVNDNEFVDVGVIEL